MKRRNLIFCFVVIFTAGMAVGGALSLHLTRDFFLRPPDPQEMEARMLSHLRSELDLSDEQLALIRPTIAKTAGEVAFYHRTAFRKIGEIMRAGDEDIKKLLNAEQTERFDKMQQRRPRLPDALKE